MSPLLYEINARCRLAEASQRLGRKALLPDILEELSQEQARLGFTHVWLMGVWKTGPKSKRMALEQKGLLDWASKHLPHAEDLESCIGASPYALSSYTVAKEFGGDEALAELRRKLNSEGLKLILDFVPNHTGLDHPWLREQPELFVRALSSQASVEAGFRDETLRVACGKDPYFPAWSDTAQLDYRSARTQAAMMEQLLHVAEKCDGVRCDMAMLVLNQVFRTNWLENPPPKDETTGEFWPAVIQEVKASFPEFLFLGEVYWGLEPTLITMGFDYVYDKVLYDKLLAGNAAAAREHVYSQSPMVLAHSAHFLENHDEQRTASVLPLDRHRAAAMLMLALPGMGFIHDGQPGGARIHIPVQALLRPHEPENPEIVALYDEAISSVAGAKIGSADWELIEPLPGSVGGEGTVVVASRAHPPGSPHRALAAINLATQPASLRLRFDPSEARKTRLRMTEGTAVHFKPGPEIHIDLPSCGWLILKSP